MPNEVLELMSQPVRTQGGGGVEYLPAPRQKGSLKEGPLVDVMILSAAGEKGRR